MTHQVARKRTNAAARWRPDDLAWMTTPNSWATHLVRVITNWGRYSWVSVESVATASDGSHLRITVRPQRLHDVPIDLVEAWERLPLN